MGMGSAPASWPSCRRIVASRGRWVSRISVSGSLSTKYVLMQFPIILHCPTLHPSISRPPPFCIQFLLHTLPFHILHFTFSYSTFCILSFQHHSHLTFSNSMYSHFTFSFHIIPPPFSHSTFSHSTFSHSTFSHSTLSHSPFSHSPCSGPR